MGRLIYPWFIVHQNPDRALSLLGINATVAEKNVKIEKGGYEVRARVAVLNVRVLHILFFKLTAEGFLFVRLCKLLDHISFVEKTDPMFPLTEEVRHIIFLRGCA